MKLNSPRLIFSLWSYLKIKRKRQIYFAFFLMVFNAFMEMVSIASVIPFIILISEPEKVEKLKTIKNFFISINFIQNDSQFLLLSSFTFITLILFSSFIRIINIKFAFNLAANIANDFSSEAYFKSLNKSYEEHLLDNSSKFISTSLLEVNRVEGVIFYTLSFSIGFITTLTIIATLLTINFLMTITTSLILGIGYLVVSEWSKKILKNNSFIISNSNNSQVKLMQEGFGSIREVILEGFQPLYAEKYKNFDYLSRIKLAEKNFISAIPRYIFEAFTITLMVFFALFYSLFSKNSGSIIPNLALFALAAQKLLPAMQLCYSSLSNVRGCISSLEKVKEILDQKLDNKIILKRIKPYILKKELVFENVSFAYQNKNRVLDNINFKIYKGEKIGISGKTGSGKSTLIDLILGLLEPKDGNIYVDGKNLNHYKNRSLYTSWQKSLAHVPQQIYLNDCSIKENIAFGIPTNQIDKKLLNQAIQLSLTGEFVSELPHGINTLVGEKGFLLSGGQRQRIGIARALYKKSNILILDEATNALDQKTERKIISQLCKKSSKTTVIMISHNNDILRYCDRIIKFVNGKLDYF